MPSVVTALGATPADLAGSPGPDPLGLTEALAGVRRVAVLLVDGLGYHLLPKLAPVAPVLADALAGRLGRLSPLTCGFPSTTPVSLVSLGTGVPPGSHGVVGFTLNIPGTDRVLNHIEWGDEPDPVQWQPVPTQFARAAASGVAVTVVGRASFAGSGLTVAAYRGGEFRGADDVDALAAEMLAALTGSTRSLVYGYYGLLDTAGHVSGVDSPQWMEQAAVVDALVARLVDGVPPDGALLVTADHGQLDVPPGHRFDVDTDPRLAAGLRVVAGEPRVRHLYTRPGAQADVVEAWREVLGEAAWVVPRDEMVATGWFGTVPPAHLARVGDVVIACRDTYAVLASARERPIVATFVGYHGSFTPAEMTIPLLLVRNAARGDG
ncbi:MAG: alkaline phosphatase family protein, partial [Micromonosporaceae bacterium]|nr:alkaline phosphatase family protein [Micromonosporaceae bacterium]